MKKLAVMVYEIREKVLDYIPEGFPVLVWDMTEKHALDRYTDYKNYVNI